jgi:TatD DNase family protein
MLDIHAHLYWESFDADRGEVVARARAAGVRQIVVVGTTLEESARSITVAEQYDDMYASVGIHPNEFRRQVGEYAEELEVLARHKKVVAIGECGLDYSESHGGIDEETKERQRVGLIEQLALAEKLCLPVIVHCRAANNFSDDAYRDLIGLLKGSAHKLKAVVLHCYMGDTEVTKDFLALPNIYFSFTGNITYPVKKELVGTKHDLTETVRLIPWPRIFIETDAPFLSPQKKRGERNEPSFAITTAEKVCELLDLTREILDQELEKNFIRIFD